MTELSSPTTGTGFPDHLYGISMVSNENALASICSASTRNGSGCGDSAQDCPGMAQTVGAFDWATTAIGPQESWSAALKSAVQIVLANPFPQVLWWGADHFQIYNDACAPILGKRNPEEALGRPARECWAEVWDTISPLVGTSFSQGVAVWREDFRLDLCRKGFVQQRNFTIGLAPVPDASAPHGIGGVLATIHETTRAVIRQRQLRGLQELGARLSAAKSAQDVCSFAVETLAANAEDVPFAMAYLLDAQRVFAGLAGSAGVRRGGSFCPESIQVGPEKLSESLWPLQTILEGKEMEVVNDLASTFPGDVPPGFWPEPPNTAVILPIRPNGIAATIGFLICGVSPRLEFDGSYAEFFNEAVAQITGSIRNAQEHEAEKTRIARLRREAQDAAWESEQRFAVALANNPAPAVLTRMADGTFLEVNDVFLQMLGYTREEVIGRSARTIGLWPDTGALKRFLEQLRRDGVVRNSEQKFQGKGGAVIIGQLWAQVMKMHGEEVVLSTIIDITERKRAEDLLRESERRVSLAVSCARGGVWEYNIATGQKKWERGMASLLGLDPATADQESEKWFSYVHPEDQEPLARLYGEIIEGARVSLETQFRVLLRDGSTRWLLTHATRVYDGRGPRLVGFDQDITERREADLALEAARRSVERERNLLQAVMNGASNAHLVYLDRDFNILCVNETYARYCGYAPHEMVGKNHFDLYPDDENEAAFRRVRDTGQPVAFHDKPLVVPGKPELALTYWDWMLNPVKNPSGEVEGLVFSLHETTARKRAEDALRESEERFRAMADGTPITIWVTDTEGNDRYVNRAFCEFFGVSGDEVESSGWQPLVHPDDRQQYVNAVMDAIRERKACTAQARARRYDGAWRWLESYAVPRFSAAGEFLGLAGSSTDITERKEFQAELERVVAERTVKLQELVSELEHFSYTLTHDLKSPLRAMRGFAEMAIDICDQTNADQKELLGRVCTAADRMDRLITDALNYSQSVRQELPLDCVDTGKLLRGMLDTYPEFQPSRAQIQIDGHLPLVSGNEAGLTQCFSNLIGNAVKFVRPGEMPQIRIWSQDRAGWTRIWIEDKGIGISREMLPRVFDMFSRERKSYEGTGIGLALVRKVAQRMGGRVGVESEEGNGSRFWLDLRPARTQPEVPQRENAPGQASGGTVLYVEDEEGDALFMERAFAARGLSSCLRLVNDGRAAIEYLSGKGTYADRKEHPIPSLVLLDLNLPGVPGFEVLKWMRMSPDFASTPVVVFSSSTRDDDRLRAQELGANDFVVKPKSGMEFGGVVKRLQERWQI